MVGESKVRGQGKALEIVVYRKDDRNRWDLETGFLRYLFALHLALP